MKIYTAVILLLFAGFCHAQEQTKRVETDNGQRVEELLIIGTPNEDLTEPTLQAVKLFEVPGADGDPLQAIFSLPGVLFADDDGAEPAVRGSAPEDNIFLVDSLPTGNIYHPFGFSVFNKNVIADFTLLAAAYPAEYTEATGAVFDVKLRDPRKQDMAYTVDYSLIRAGVMAEGAITENQAFYFSYRRSMIDLYYDADSLNEEDDDDDDGIKVNKVPTMSDYQGKYVWNINDNNKLSFLVLGSKDDFDATVEKDAAEALIDPDVAGRLKYDDLFHSQSISWRRDFASGGRFDFIVGNLHEDEEISLGNGQFLNLLDTTKTVKTKLSQPLGRSHTIALGTEHNRTEVKYKYDLKIEPCSDFQPECFPDQNDRVQDANKLEINSKALFAEDRWQLHEDVLLTVGVNVADDDYLKERLTEPRASLRWAFSQDWAVKVAGGEYHRFPDGEQIIREIGNPNLLKFKAKHYVLGFEHDDPGSWDWSLEFYYKDLYDLPLALGEDAPDADLNYVNDAEGEARGVELLIEKHLTDRWYGWLAISLAESERTDLRTNKTTKFTGDTPRVVNSVMNYQLNDAWNIGFRYTWRSGAAYTPIVGLQPNPDFPKLFRPVYGDLNSRRLPNYQRLDLRAEYEFLMFDNDASLVIEIINLTNQQNISGYSYDPKPSDTPTKFRLEKETGLAFYPSVGLKVVF